MSGLGDAIVSVFIFFLSLLGLYGNACFALTIYRHKELRTARGLLLSSLCTMHNIVLTNFVVSRIFFAYGIATTRQTCLLIYSLPPGIYAASHHTILYFVLVADIAFSLIAPIRYSTLPQLPYVLVAQIPCILYSGGLIIAHFLSDSQPGIVTNQCIFSDVFQTSVANFRIQFGNVLNLSIVAVYIVIVVLLCRLQNMTRQKRQAIKSILIMAFFFISSQFVVFAVAYASFFFPPEIATSVRAFHKKFSVVYALPAYCLTYYIHFTVSKDYRRAFATTGLCGIFLKQMKLDNLVSVSTTAPRIVPS